MVYRILMQEHTFLFPPEAAAAEAAVVLLGTLLSLDLCAIFKVEGEEGILVSIGLS